MLLVTSLALCFGFAIAAAQLGLAPIVGAFAAGLVLEERHYSGLPNLEPLRIEALLEPITSLVIPVFFVLMGMTVDLRTFGSGSAILFALVLTVAAIAGKQISALGVVGKSGRTANRWIVGMGMMPRGEVGLIFAGIGLTLTVGGRPVVPPDVYSALVTMVILTTMAAPPALVWMAGRLERSKRVRGIPRPAP
jgi:Kef-type K+ transport system membrane component KefB